MRILLPEFTPAPPGISCPPLAFDAIVIHRGCIGLVTITANSQRRAEYIVSILPDVTQVLSVHLAE